MRSDMRKLRAKMVEQGKTQEQLARWLSVSEGTISRKMKGEGAEFSAGQILEIASFLHLGSDDIVDIFFTQ